MSDGPLPEILAPAGDRSSFLAAVAAGADAVYCGLKQFSARMAAKNFALEELAGLTALAHEEGTRVYIAVNTLLKPSDLERAGQLLADLTRQVGPDALIFQDLALFPLAKAAGFSGERHLSTLANVSAPGGLEIARNGLGADRVVIPRELTIDEIRAMADACPPGLGLEIFVHGALCYGVSGRCYWSSYMGGKSGLRGRCVQPCRRIYSQEGADGRFFSCRDLSLDVLVKVLKAIPRIRAWKIEGRKKGPHYVHYTTAAYKMLRDEGDDPNAKRSALQLLEMALGRPATHYAFLPQRPYNPIPPDGQTGSGYIVGHVKGPSGKRFLSPRIALLPGDTLRVGYEDQPGHGVQRVTRSVPKGGRLQLKGTGKKGPGKGGPVFLVDRREPALERMISDLSERVPAMPASPGGAGFEPRRPEPAAGSGRPRTLHVARSVGDKRPSGEVGLWMTPDLPGTLSEAERRAVWWWLPPVIWPGDKGGEEALWRGAAAAALEKGGRRFVLNAPWQTALFPDPGSAELWAGPFCNAANPLALEVLKEMGFAGAVLSPELSGEDYRSLPKTSPLDLGVVLWGHWPLCISRTLSEDLKTDAGFVSPKGEAAWAAAHGPNVWVYPNWVVDLRAKKSELAAAGFRLFVHIQEPLPKGIQLKDRPGLWNWDLPLA
jgi:U32 family peptidase